MILFSTHQLVSTRRNDQMPNVTATQLSSNRWPTPLSPSILISRISSYPNRDRDPQSSNIRIMQVLPTYLLHMIWLTLRYTQRTLIRLLSTEWLNENSIRSATNRQQTSLVSKVYALGVDVQPTFLSLLSLTSYICQLYHCFSKKGILLADKCKENHSVLAQTYALPRSFFF